MRFLGLLCVVLLSVLISDAQYDDLFQYFKRNERQRMIFCGKYLANQLSMLCKGHYNSMFNNEGKRSEDIAEVDYLDTEDDAVLLPGIPWIPRHDASALRPLRSARLDRRRRGAVDECCNKACTIAELTSYCEPDEY